MKKWMIVLVALFFTRTGFTQGQEAQQLLLNVEKLVQFKKILQNMKDGYQVLYKAYTTISNISEGNFSLHKVFLDAMLEVSPAVRRYKRIADIVQYQARIVKDQKYAFSYFKESEAFSLEEISYLGKVYRNLLQESARNIDELSLVITAGKLRMSDEERLQAIDRIYAKIEDQYHFLQDFNNTAAVLVLQRKSEQAAIALSKRIQGN